MTESDKIFTNLSLNIINHRPVIGHYHTSKYKVVKHYRTVFITGIEEIVMGIYTAAPDTNCIKVTIAALLYQIICTLFTVVRKNIIFRNIVGTHCKADIR